jgi:hypothetical protein
VAPTPGVAYLDRRAHAIERSAPDARRKSGLLRIEATDDMAAVARAKALLAADEEDFAALVKAPHPSSRPECDAVRLVKEVWSKDLDA